MKKTLALLMAMVMLFVLAACGQSTAPAATEAPAAVEEAVATEAPAAAEAPATTDAPADTEMPVETESSVEPGFTLVEAELDGVTVGTLCLPEDWNYTMEVMLKPEGAPLPLDIVIVREEEKGITLHLQRLGPDAYEVAGVPMPADLEEFSLRSGPQMFLKEGEEYTYDELGNLCVVHEFVLDGEPCGHCSCLKQAENAMGYVQIYYPLGTEIENLSYILANSSLADISDAES